MRDIFSRKIPNTKINKGKKAHIQVEDTLEFKKMACCHCPDTNEKEYQSPLELKISDLKSQKQ